METYEKYLTEIDEFQEEAEYRKAMIKDLERYKKLIDKAIKSAKAKKIDQNVVQAVHTIRRVSDTGWYLYYWS